MRLVALYLLVICMLATFAMPAWGQTTQSEDVPSPVVKETDGSEVSAPAGKVDVDPAAGDQQIEERLRRILNATTWFSDLDVSVKEGVVFVQGRVDSEQHREWATNLARQTQDVVAVVNRAQVTERSMWDFSPAWKEMHSLSRDMIQSLPVVSIGFAIAVLTWFVSGLVSQVARRLFKQRMVNVLIADVAARTVAVVTFVIGLYLALRVSGLTQVAATLVGGTGLLGLIIGIAFRDIAENFLASLLISVQRPFALGDLIEIDGQTGYVRSVTMRGTLLMTLEGNHLQIPNSVVYKSTIRNMTANPNVRLQFDIFISYGDSIGDAQDHTLNVLKEHEAVLSNPEPMVLVESLGSSNVKLRIYFWIDGIQHSRPKVRSAVIRLVTRALQDAGFNLSGAAPVRELLVPPERPIAVRMIKVDQVAEQSQSPVSPAVHGPQRSLRTSHKPEPAATAAEGGLESEAAELEQQAQNSRSPEPGQNLLADAKEST